MSKRSGSESKDEKTSKRAKIDDLKSKEQSLTKELKLVREEIVKACDGDCWVSNPGDSAPNMFDSLFSFKVRNPFKPFATT